MMEELKELERLLTRIELMANGAMQLSLANAERLNAHSERLDAMAKTLKDLQTQIDADNTRIDQYTTEIGNDLRVVATQLQDFKDRLANGELVTADQIQPLIDGLTTRADALQQVAASADNLVPPPPPPIVLGSGSAGSVSASTSESSGSIPFPAAARHRP